MDNEAIQSIKAKSRRVKLPLNEMVILGSCVATGAVIGAAGMVIREWKTLRVEPERVPGEIGFGAIFGAMAGACVAVAVATLIKMSFNLAGRIADACGMSAVSDESVTNPSPKQMGEAVKPDKVSTQS